MPRLDVRFDLQYESLGWGLRGGPLCLRSHDLLLWWGIHVRLCGYHLLNPLCFCL